MHFFYDFESLESISFNEEKSVKESYGSKNYMKDIVCDDKDKLNKNKESFKNMISNVMWAFQFAITENRQNTWADARISP